jgi:hypothetical protein
VCRNASTARRSFAASDRTALAREIAGNRARERRIRDCDRHDLSATFRVAPCAVALAKPLRNAYKPALEGLG